MHTPVMTSISLKLTQYALHLPVPKLQFKALYFTEDCWSRLCLPRAQLLVVFGELRRPLLTRNSENVTISSNDDDMNRCIEAHVENDDPLLLSTPNLDETISAITKSIYDVPEWDVVKLIPSSKEPTMISEHLHSLLNGIAVKDGEKIYFQFRSGQCEYMCCCSGIANSTGWGRISSDTYVFLSPTMKFPLLNEESNLYTWDTITRKKIEGCLSLALEKQDLCTKLQIDHPYFFFIRASETNDAIQCVEQMLHGKPIAISVIHPGDCFSHDGDGPDTWNYILESLISLKVPFVAIFPFMDKFLVADSDDEIDKFIVSFLSFLKTLRETRGGVAIGIIDDENTIHEEVRKLATEEFEFIAQVDRSTQLVSGSGVSFEKPDVKFSDICGLDEVKVNLAQCVLWPRKCPERFSSFGIHPPSGVLLYGPPGTGKTMLAKAVATECDASFISVSIADVMKGEIGESEKQIREIFRRANLLGACTIFFDEVQAIFSGLSSGRQILSQMIVEMDTLQLVSNAITIIAATNRPDMIDSSLLAPGRLERILYVPLPEESSRLEMIHKYLSRIRCNVDDVLLTNDLLEKTKMYSGADIANMCNQAALLALEKGDESTTISHIMEVVKTMHPSVSDDTVRFLESWSP